MVKNIKQSTQGLSTTAISLCAYCRETDPEIALVPMNTPTNANQTGVNPGNVDYDMHGHMLGTEFQECSAGGFCDCDDGHKARSIPVGTKVRALANLCFHVSGEKDGQEPDFLYTKGDGHLHVTYEFRIETGEWAGQWVMHEFGVGDINSWPPLQSELAELRQMINSASNIFPWDTSASAEVQREDSCSEVRDTLKLINDMPIAIEIGVAPGRTGWNCVARILEPDDPDYVSVMEIDGYAEAGTGIDGDHITPPPPPSPSGIHAPRN